MDTLAEHEIIGHYYQDEENEGVLDRLRCNDSTLKELTLEILTLALWHSQSIFPMILQAFDTIATNSSLKILNICGNVPFLLYHRANVQVREALRRNASLKHLHIAMSYYCKLWLSIIWANPHPEALTIRKNTRPNNEITAFAPFISDITGMAQVPSMDTNLHSLTIEGFHMDSGEGTA